MPKRAVLSYSGSSRKIFQVGGYESLCSRARSLGSLSTDHGEIDDDIRVYHRRIMAAPPPQDSRCCDGSRVIVIS